VLEVRGLSGRGFTDVDLRVRRGEILGLAGIEGSGQRGVLSALAGTESARGSVMLNGTSVRLNSIRSARKHGISYVPEDRHNVGLFLSVGVGDNVLAGVAPRHTRFGFINRRSMNTQAAGVVDSYHIKTPSLATPIGSLSGGNQQKALLARAALEHPRVLIADEPTQGVDAGARVQIYQALSDLCDSGSSVVVLSSDAVEMAGLCDRVLVFSRGHVVRELEGDELTAHRITESALTSTVLRGGGEQNSRRLLAGARGWVPAAVVAITLIVLGILAATQNSRYATSLNLSNLLTLFAPLAFVAMGQLFALILGGIDLTVGPVMGLTVVACSFMIPPTAGLPDSVWRC
jgi:ribose transport system ATP-binding protein